MSLSDNTMTALKKMLSVDEGRRNHVYFDTKGIATIGCGRNISSTGPGLRESEIDFLLQNDINWFLNAWETTYPWFNALSEARKAALVDFSFCGMKTVGGFKKMLLALSEGRFEGAAKELLNSAYAKQVGSRAHRLAKILVTGDLWI